MTRAFPLAGLLRLRKLQEETAASKLAAANARVREAGAVQAQAYEELAQSPVAAADSAALYAVAAARASSRAMLAELAAVGTRRTAEAETAQTAFRSARADSVGLEKLEARHAVEAAAEDRRTEQTVLDELAGSAWQRQQKEAH